MSAKLILVGETREGTGESKWKFSLSENLIGKNNIKNKVVNNK